MRLHPEKGPGKTAGVLGRRCFDRLAILPMLACGALLLAGCGGGGSKGPGHLNIQSSPPGAAVLIDGQPTGQVTPVTIPNLEPGVKTVRLETTDEFWQGEVTIESGRTTSVEATLKPLFVPPDPPL